VQDFADRRGAPATRAPLLRARRGRADIVEGESNHPKPLPTDAAVEDLAHDRRLVVVDDAAHAADILAHVVVPEGPAPANVPGFGLTLHRIVGALPRFLPLEFVGKRRERQHDLVGGAVQRPLAVFEVEEHADTGLDDLLQRVADFDLLTSTVQPRFAA
jgi:hypothetical protein